MPSRKKTLYYLASALATSIAVGLLGFGMSTDWVEISMDCGREESERQNGTAVITMGLFNGVVERESCPQFGGEDKFEVIPALAGKENATAPLVLYGLVVCLVVLCLLFSAISLLITLYNSVSNPYETYMGPIGVYTCSAVSACLSVVVIILFAVNVNVTNVAEILVTEFTSDIAVVLTNKSTVTMLGFYLIIPYTVLSLLAIALIYVYDHAAYTRRREQEKPTEDAPKEVMMY
ncbi:clarin-3 [Pholidichthys leucotaenia]